MEGGARLAGRLLAAAEWFNQALVARLAARGWPRLTRTQSQVFALLSSGAVRPAALAREVGITRQSMHTLLRGLAAEGLVAVEPDPDDGRASRVRLEDRGQALVADAGEVLLEVEAELAARIGADAVEALRTALARDWGAPPLDEGGTRPPDA